MAWDNSDGAHRPAQLARELARRGHTVTFVEIERSRVSAATVNPRVLSLQDLGWDDLNLVRAWYGVDYTAPSASKARLDEILGSSAKRGYAIYSAPFRPVLDFMPMLAERGYIPVYDALDDISEMRALGTYCYDELAENYLASNSELIVTLSPRLRERFSRYKNVTLIRDGVDLAPFRSTGAQNGADAIAQGEITLGFWGTMWDYNLDVALLRESAGSRPKWQWHFVGAYDLDPARPSLAAALAEPNVHFHPSVPRSTLAHYATFFDVCLLPTPVTPFNLARDPLKVYEYLACGKPVVATALEQLADMPYVFRSGDCAEFLSNIEGAAQMKIDRRRLDSYLDGQTWAKRTDQLLTALDALSPSTRELPPPPRGAMPGSDADVERWRAYTRHLERLVEDREIHVSDLEQALARSSTADKLKRALGLSKT